MKQLFFFALFSGLFGSSIHTKAQAPVETLGPVQHIGRQGQALLLQSKEAETRVWVYSPSIIRVSISRHIKGNDSSFAVIRKETDLRYADVDSGLEIRTSQLRLVINKSPLRFQFLTSDGKPLSGDDPRFGTNWQNGKVTTYRKLYPGERFIGLGEKKGSLDRRGRKLVNWNIDVGGDDPQYKTYPFFMGLHDSLTYGIFLDNTNRTFFDFGASTDDQMTWFGAEDGDLDYYFFGAQSVAKILEDYTWLTGRMEMPPLWSLGYQQCRWSYGSEKEVLDVAQTFRKKQIPADVLYCDIDYMDNYKIFTWKKESFPDPKRMIDQMKAMNFHLVTIVDPGIKVEKGYPQYDEGISQNYFATYPNGEPYVGAAWPGRVHFPDFFNPAVRRWWGASFTALTTPGVEGFWNDMNEPSSWGQSIPSMVRMGDRYLPEVNNVYGMQMARATYEGTRKLLGNKRPFVLTRSAFAGTQRYSAVWTGDNTANDEHLLMGQRLVNTLGLAGMAFVGVDIGGFFGNGSPHLMVRWNSLGVYTPMYRNHACTGTAYREPWRWGEANEKIIKRDIEERYRLMPYLYSAFYQAHQSGLPVSRSLAIDYTQDKHVYEEAYQTQFLFGDNILVAPVVSTVTTADVYLPKGAWYRKSTDSLYEGGKAYQVPAPLDDLPVFIKEGAIIPKQHVVQSTSDRGDEILELHLWNGKEGSSLTYYEDDGSTYDYQAGAFYSRSLRFDPVKRKLLLEAVRGNFPSRYKSLKLVLHGFEKVEKVQINGRGFALKNNAMEGLVENSRAAMTLTF